MTTPLTFVQDRSLTVDSSVQPRIEEMIDELITSLPEIQELTSEERRGIIARYTAVLEGNFIYWMTAALIAVQAEEARPIILDNLHEEIRDSHPAMLRRFTIAAHAMPNDIDALVVHHDLTQMRLFLGRLRGAQIVLTMAFFEGFIQRFMSYLADLAAAQGSDEREYTDVHGICDIAHTQGLFEAFAAEVSVAPPAPGADLFEGVYLLRALLQTIVSGQDRKHVA